MIAEVVASAAIHVLDLAGDAYVTYLYFQAAKVRVLLITKQTVDDKLPYDC